MLPPSCQSCGIPIKHPTEFGRTASGAMEIKYCGYCIEKGEFTDKDITVEGMIEKVAGALAKKEKIDLEAAKGKVGGIIASLDRWKKED
jgi:C4-type Zn-finger protein